jgi:hypothetical protein
MQVVTKLRAVASSTAATDRRYWDIRAAVLIAASSVSVGLVALEAAWQNESAGMVLRESDEPVSRHSLSDNIKSLLCFLCNCIACVDFCSNSHRYVPLKLIIESYHDR